MCVTPQGYENTSRNAAETLRWVGEAKYQLDYYKSDSAGSKPAFTAEKDNNPN